MRGPCLARDARESVRERVEKVEGERGEIRENKGIEKPAPTVGVCEYDFGTFCEATNDRCDTAKVCPMVRDETTPIKNKDRIYRRLFCMSNLIYTV